VQDELVIHFLQLAPRMLGVTISDLLRLSFHIAELSHFSHRLNKDKEISGKKW